MAKGGSKSSKVLACTTCGEAIMDSESRCPTCGCDVGAPNVRACGQQEELEALENRHVEARNSALANGCALEFDAFVNAVNDGADVGIAAPASVVMNLVKDPRSIYVGYETLVGAGLCRPATFVNSSHRRAVGGLLFGDYGDKIVYGFLTITDRCLSTYGEMFLRCRRVAIQNRVSFLEKNSYHFVKEHHLEAGEPLPKGYRADWVNRAKLAAAKLGSELGVGSDITAWDALLTKSDGNDRSNDDFIEAHIFGGVNAHAIESIAAVESLPREARICAKIAHKEFRKLRSSN